MEKQNCDLQCIDHNFGYFQFFWLQSKFGIAGESYRWIVSPRAGSEHTLEVQNKSGGEALVIPEELKRICKCESEWKHFDDNGEVLRGHVNPQDIGICQINLEHWGADAEKLGLDVFRKEDNIKMAIWIYEQHGIWPWKASGFCWVDNTNYEKLYKKP